MRRLWIKIFFLPAVFLVPALYARGQSSTAQDSHDKVSRGKYLVERVALCVECHTPRNRSGHLSRDEYLNGAPVPVEAPPYAGFQWALKAPAIAGLPGYNEAQGARLLTQGITRDGRTPKPPMPPFRLSVSDAEAVVAYLKSLE